MKINAEASPSPISHHPHDAAKSFEAKFQRILEASNAKSDSELARALNIRPSSVGAAKKRGQLPPGWIEEVAEKFNISADWLFYGIGPMRRGEAPSAPAQTKPGGLPGVCFCTDCDVVLVQKVRARLSAGTGSLETNDEPVGAYSFRSDWIRRKGTPTAMVLMEVVGDSMEPEIQQGDMVLLDQSQTDILPGGIYAVGIDDGIVVKSVDKAPGKLILRSRNERYQPLEIDLRGDLADTVRIIGRVVWWCHEAK